MTPSTRTTDTSSSSGHRPSSALGRLAAVAHRRRGRVLLLWLVALLTVSGLSAAFAGEYSADYSAHGSDSVAAQDLLEQRFPQQGGQTIDVVVFSPTGVNNPAVQADVRQLLTQAATVPSVIGTEDPFSQPGRVSPDGRTALGSIFLGTSVNESAPVADTKQIIAFAQAAEGPGLRIELGGGAIQEAEAGQVGSEAIGIAAAAIILLLTFGSVVAAGLPLLVALVGLGIGTAIIGLLTTVVDTPDWAISLAAMMGIGVGIDYVLLMVTRFREYRGKGLANLDATIATVESAGRAVLVAGTTVVISLLGLFATDLNYMQGAAVATIAVVLVIMLAAITLLPALLGYLGPRIDRLRLPGTRPRTAGASPFWARWSRLVQRRAWLAVLAALAILVVLTLPFFNVRFGFPDAGNDPVDKTSRQAHDLAAAGFGPGASSPLLVTAQLPTPGNIAPAEVLAADIRATPGVASVDVPVLDPAGDLALLTVVPTTGAQDPATEDLVRTLRNDVLPPAAADTGLTVHVGGVTAGGIDTTDAIASKLPLLIGGVVLLSFLLLMVVFRSILVAVKAGVMNLLSIAAAYGVVAYVLQGGWAGKLIGIDTETPLPAFIPVLMFAILFGLSMDYEVFLMSRIREYWLRTDESDTAVVEGLAATARVITAAAGIMVCVFLAFVLSPDVILKVIGIGLATAIFVDATIVRMLLVPATMQLLGRSAWWIPAMLDRRLPELHVEGQVEPELQVPGPRVADEKVTAGERVGR